MEYERRRDTVLAHVTGELDHCSAQRVRRELDQMIADPGVKHLILDLKDMTFMEWLDVRQLKNMIELNI